MEARSLFQRRLAKYASWSVCVPSVRLISQSRSMAAWDRRISPKWRAREWTGLLPALPFSAPGMRRRLFAISRRQPARLSVLRFSVYEFSSATLRPERAACARGRVPCDLVLSQKIRDADHQGHT